MKLTLTKTQKIIASIAGILTVASGSAKAVTYYVDSRAKSVVAPIKEQVDNLTTDLDNHEKAPGHKEEIQKLNQVQEDLSYIRGRIDERWGKKGK